MRETKIRVWQDNKMIYFEPLKLLWSYKDRYKINADDLSDNNGSLHDDYIDKTYNKPSFMYYTGLNDNNGYEIYECDILSAVKYGTDIPTGRNRWEVYYNEERLTFYWKNQEGTEKPFWDFNLTSVQYVIIGNVYENPELLK